MAIAAPLLKILAVTEQNLPSAARQILAALPPGYNVICFNGEMGAGKTTFIRYLCEELGVKDHVSSPTYALVNEYEANDGRRICHFDFYRINNEQEAADIGTEEYFMAGALCLIEWPSRIPSLLPEKYAQISIEVKDSESREIGLTLQ